LKLETDRLRLRPWENRDRAPFAAINADPEVRRYYCPSVLDTTETDALIDQAMADLDRDGFGFVAVERKADGLLVGGAGLSRPEPLALQAWPLEIGWILGRPYWRQGFSLEIARACFAFAWRELGAGSVIGYTSAINLPSRRAMAAAGMRELADAAFDDDTVPEGDPLRPHVLYRIDRPAG
jgi:RimJ/RimL family protein N-acetyltransferase